MLTAAERRDKIAAIRQLPAALEASLSGLSEEQFDAAEGEGGWTIRQVVHHIADAQYNGYLRMKLILTETNPALKSYDQEAWAKLYDTAELPVEPSLLIIKGLHARWAALLESLPELSWSRAGTHMEFGKLTLDDVLSRSSNHGKNHVEQINQIRKSRGW